MPIELKMPALSPTMEEGTLAKWLVKEGDNVAAGDLLAEIETDKATMEFEAVDEGTISKIVVPEGTDGVKVEGRRRDRCGPAREGGARSGSEARGQGGAQGGHGRSRQGEPAGAAAGRAEGRGPFEPHGLRPRRTDREGGYRLGRRKGRG